MSQLKKTEDSPLLYPFVLFKASSGLDYAHIVEGRRLSLPTQMLISPEIPSQTHSEIMFYPLPGHLLAQSS